MLEQPQIATPVDVDELTEAFASAWRLHRNDHPSASALALLVSQSALESARWKRCFNFNLSGIKGRADQPHVYLTTQEYVPRATAERMVAASTVAEPCELAKDEGGDKVWIRVGPRHPVARFRAYLSLEQAANSKLALLATRYGAALDAAQRGDLVGFVHGLAARGYFTAPESGYRAGVERFYLEFAPPRLSTQGEISVVLEGLGYDTSNYDGAVRKFQADHALGVDGAVGEKTRRAMRQQLAGGASCPPNGAA